MQLRRVRFQLVSVVLTQKTIGLFRDIPEG